MTDWCTAWHVDWPINIQYSRSGLEMLVGLEKQLNNKKPELRGAAESDWVQKLAYSASANSCGKHKALLPVAHCFSLSVGWLATCTPDYVGACLLPKLKQCGQRQAAMLTLLRQSVMSGSFGDRVIGWRHWKRKLTDYKMCLYPSAILSKV